MSRNGSATSGGRRDAHAEDSRRAILSAARTVFAAKGYADTSLDDIVAPAGLTKGALYHHFKNKAALLEAVYVEMEEELVDYVRVAVMALEDDDPWGRLLVALDAFFTASGQKDYVRIVLLDAPLVLGHRQGRALDHAIGLGFVRVLITGLVDARLAPDLPITTASRMILSAISEVAVAMADSDHPERERQEGMEVAIAMLEGLRHVTTKTRKTA